MTAAEIVFSLCIVLLGIVTFLQDGEIRRLRNDLKYVLNRSDRHEIDISHLYDSTDALSADLSYIQEKFEWMGLNPFDEAVIDEMEDK